MKNIEMAFRSFFKKGRNNGIKVISLGVGLALGLVLISKVCFERSFDTFYPDTERIYRLHENLIRDNEYISHPQVSGGVSLGMQEEIPEVEKSTRLTYVGGDRELFTTDKKERFSARYAVMADTNYFDMFPRPVLIGNPKEVLARPNYLMVSHRIAGLLGGVEQAVGRTFSFDANPGILFTVGGVYEDIPENSHLRTEIIISLETMHESSRNNWLGNDRYLGYVKLYPGTDPESLTEAIREMQGRHCDLSMLEKAGVDLTYSLVPLMDMHRNKQEVKNMNLLLAVLALVLILSAVMNYVLIMISSLVSRTKEVAVHKCYGASGRNLSGMILSETFLHLFLALLFATLLILAFREKAEDLLGATLGSLFMPRTLFILGGVCLLIFLITGLIPTYLFMRIPVAAAFRNFQESRRYWKLGLLFVQFVATAYLVMFLGIIIRQHHFLTKKDLGYSYERLAYCPTEGVDPSARKTVMNELRKMPEVESVSACSELLFGHMSGNNIYLPGDDRELFNIADLYWVDESYFSLMEIPVIDGEVFRPDGSAANKVMVSRSFVKKMEQVAGWSGSAVGKSIVVTEHSHQGEPFTICGVYEDFTIGHVGNPEMRPTVVFYGNMTPHILIKFHQMTPEGMRKVQSFIEAQLPDKEINVKAYYSEMVDIYRDSRKFRDSVMIGGIVTLIIAIVGLLGYISDEMKRRGREIAIRKVNGATIRDILQMISLNISYMAVPAIVIGSATAVFSGKDWLQQYAEKFPMEIGLYLLATVPLLAFILICVLFRIRSMANENPVERLKAE